MINDKNILSFIFQNNNIVVQLIVFADIFQQLNILFIYKYSQSSMKKHTL